MVTEFEASLQLWHSCCAQDRLDRSDDPIQCNEFAILDPGNHRSIDVLITYSLHAIAASWNTCITSHHPLLQQVEVCSPSRQARSPPSPNTS